MTDDALEELRRLKDRLRQLETLAEAQPTEGASTMKPYVTLQHSDPGYDTPDERRRKSIAATFRRSEIHESLIERQAAALGGNMVAHLLMEALSPSERMSFGSYVNARDAAIAENLVDQNGDPR